MGNFFSRIRLAIRELLTLSLIYEALTKRLQKSPGLPVQNPSLSFWTIPPSPIANHLSDLPAHADVVIIGAGLTGTSFARTVLDYGSQRPLQVVMLDARDACSGASGRNGGHINPVLYLEYEKLKKSHGRQMAKKLIRFRLRHFAELKRISEEEGILEQTQCREVEHCDVYYDPETFDSAKKRLQVYKTDMATEAAGFQVHNSQEAMEKFHLAPDVAGCISNRGGAINPYRLVTGVLSRLLSQYRHNFYLLTNTPCTAISPPTPTTPFYTLTTPRGTITTPHIVHATNAHASHLLPSFRCKVIPTRGIVTAQRPGLSLDKCTLNGLRSFVFYRQKFCYDYVTQLPAGENELIVGGGFGSVNDDTTLKQIGNADDSEWDGIIAAHLSGAMPICFGENHWGAEKQPQTDSSGEKWNDGRVKATWSGAIALSADLLPWVGRLPNKLSRRRSPPTSSTPVFDVSKGLESKDTLAEAPVLTNLTSAPGEWISASYSGEGMVHAWLCAKALALMVLGAEKEGGLEEWFPEILTVSEERWKKANVEYLLEELAGS